MSKHTWCLPLAVVFLAIAWSGVAAAQPPSPPPAPSTQALVDSLRMELHKVELQLATERATQYPSGEGRRIANSVMTGLVFITFFSGLFAYLVLRQNNQRKVYLAAIEHGASIPLPRNPRTDARRPALVLMAAGLGFFIAMYATLSLVHEADAPAPLAVSIWGVIPILIGGALWVYQRISIKERQEGKSPASEAD